MINRFLWVTVVLVGTVFSVQTQNLANPFDFPMQLSGSFCDLRAGHFHAGIDIRTQGTEGHAVHAVANGYISRVSVSPSGYGNAVYITHPESNLITVYGHLQRFTKNLTQKVKEQQYAQESFSIDLTFDSTEFPVKQGDIIAYSGNSGSSGGPHLHLEVRNLENNELIDPLTYYKSKIPDTRKPIIRGIIVYPVENKGIANNSARKQKIDVTYDANENPLIKTNIEAWGDIGLEIRAVDRMNGTNFSYGVRNIVVETDDTETFHSNPQRFFVEESRYLNTYTDYAEWSESGHFYINTFVEPGNNLRFITARNAGIISIDEERTYNITFTLTDIYGNKSVIPLKIKGKEQKINSVDTENLLLFGWDKDNRFTDNGIRLSIPPGGLYKNLYPNYKILESNGFYSPVHQFLDFPVPLHKPAQISIRIDSLIPDSNTDQYGIVKVKNGKITSWIGGSYMDGWMEADISELSYYSVSRDTVNPVITPLNTAKWRENKQIRIKISDTLSGIYSFRGEIDGKYALFEYDSKNALLKYTFDNERVPPGYHRIKLTVIDRCRNKSVYENAFTW
ncbi:MAG: M23 family metallopeptidase [Tannerella sp.]|jgi:hypothetical protein|nr:M23 family metallopeptidase [Tannerella sp.]